MLSLAVGPGLVVIAAQPGAKDADAIASIGSPRRSPLAGGWCDGHAADARGTRAGRLRRSLESRTPRSRARDPAALRRGRRRLHPDEYVRRLPYHAPASRAR